MNCKVCKTKAVWIVHGGFVGEYWYCRTCKIEVDSEVTIPAAKLQASEQEAFKWGNVKFPNFAAPPTPRQGYTAPTGLASTGLSVTCTKGPTCAVCSGFTTGAGMALPGIKLICVIPDSKKRLTFGTAYEIFNVTKNGARFLVQTAPLTTEILEFTLCRFRTI